MIKKFLFKLIREELCAYINRALHNRLWILISIRDETKLDSDLEMKIAFMHELIYINDNIQLMKSKEVVNYEIKKKW